MDQSTACSDNPSTQGAMHTVPDNGNGGEATESTERLTAEKLTEVLEPANVRISPNGQQVVYCLRPVTRTRDLELSSLYIADIDNEGSARLLTSGDYMDDLPQWSPDGKTVAFVSDRGGRGRCSAIYLLTLDNPQPQALTPITNKGKISFFKWSPDGKSISFLSPDEESKKKGRDDAYVYQERWMFNRLRCVDVQTKECRVLVEEEYHIVDFDWNHKSTRIVFASQTTPDRNSPYKGEGSSFEVLDIRSQVKYKFCTFPGPSRNLVWDKKRFLFLSGAMPHCVSTASMVFQIDLDTEEFSPLSNGDIDCAEELRKIGDNILKKVENGLYDEIRLLDEGVLYYVLNEITTWDYHPGTEVFVIGKSSINEPPELHEMQDSYSHRYQLTFHNKSISNLSIATTHELHLESSDGIALDALLFTPTGPQPTGGWPTFVGVHGGPYQRATNSFDVPKYAWGPWLCASGYAVLCPNYRGGAARGEKFAAYARGGMGQEDYADIITILEHAIEEGHVDKERVAISGWSQGGFLSYLAVTRPERFPFRAAVCGAGVTDWDSLIISSDFPVLEAELAGGAPWKVEVGDAHARYGSPLWHLKGADTKTPLLMLHGGKDERIPLSQARGFYNACVDLGVDAQLVVYPREGHDIVERAHRVDMLKRVKNFLDEKLAAPEDEKEDTTTTSPLPSATLWGILRSEN